MSGLRDYRVELLRYAPFTASPAEAPIDITDRTLLDGFGAINRAAERDLLSFKTGDLTVTFRDHDGFLEDLFAHFGPADRWQLRVYRRGEIQFWGVVLGQGSVIFDRTEKTCEITAYGLTRQLNDTSAETVKRRFSTTSPLPVVSGFKVVTATSGSTTLTVEAYVSLDAPLTTGDVLHLTDHVNSEDVIIKQVGAPDTTLTLETALVNSYAAGTVVTLSTPFYRYRAIEFLVRELFAAADAPVAQLDLDESQFRHLAPAPVNLGGLTITLRQRSAATEKDGRAYISQAGGATFYQGSPEDAWAQEDANDRSWVDWSRYYREDETPPTIILRNPVTGDDNDDASGNVRHPHFLGFNYKDSTKRAYYIEVIAPQGSLREYTTTDGVTWVGPTTVLDLPGAAAMRAWFPLSCEFDPARNAVYCSYIVGGAPDTAFFELYDVAGASFSSAKQADDGVANGYWGAVYVPSKDYTLCLRASVADDLSERGIGSDFEICAFRGTARLWKRPFPSAYIPTPTTGDRSRPVVPTMTLREVDGSLYCLVVHDGAVQLVRSDDEFMTYTTRKIVATGNDRHYFGSRVLGQYRIFSYDGAAPRALQVAAPFFAGVISYADFEGLSVAEALKRLSVLTNAIFWVDDAGEGHFVARDLFDPGAVLEIGDRIKDRADTAIWDQTVQYVEVGEMVSGDNNFSSSGLSLDTDLSPNEAFDQALADDYVDFYSRRRAELELTVQDTDGHIYQPLDRVTIDSIRYMVYESDHDLPNDEVRLTLLEDV